MRETVIRNGTVSMWRTAWKIYSTFVVTGAIIGTVSYGVLTLADRASFVSFIAITRAARDAAFDSAVTSIRLRRAAERLSRTESVLESQRSQHH